MLEFWVPLVIYIKSSSNSISLLCISLHKDKEGIVLFAIKIKRSSNFPINRYKRLMGMCHWIGSHFHGWIDYGAVANFRILGIKTVRHIYV